MDEYMDPWLRHASARHGINDPVVVLLHELPEPLVQEVSEIDLATRRQGHTLGTSVARGFKAKPSGCRSRARRPGPPSPAKPN